MNRLNYIIASTASALIMLLPVKGNDQLNTIIKDVSETGELLQKNNLVLDAEKMRPALLKTMIRTIDPTSAVITKTEAERIKEDLQGYFYGIGVKLTKQNEYLKIKEIIDSAPASKNDSIQEEMLITKIDGASTKEMTVNDAVDLLRGRDNEETTLTVKQKKEDDTNTTVNITLKRDIIERPVTGVMESWPHELGYIRVNGLYRGSGSQIVTQLQKWAQTNYYGVILDLRDANGLDMESAANIASLFTKPETLLFSVRNGKNKVITNFYSKATEQINMPVMVLANGGTQHACETLTAVLQKCKGVMFIGSETAGNNTIPEFIPLPAGEVLYIATKFITVNNQNRYSKEGVTPNIIVSADEQIADFQTENEEETAADYFAELSKNKTDDLALADRVSNDAVLQRATDILLGLKALDIH
jgi:carboxyl-terminal processing protease